MIRHRRWLVALLGGLVVVAVAAALPPAASAIVGSVLQLVVFVAVVRTAGTTTTSGRTGWGILALSCGIGLVTSVITLAMPTHLAGAVWVAALALRQLAFMLGLATILRERDGLRADRHLLDAGIITVGVTVCVWALVIEPRHGLYPPQRPEALTGFAFAALDFLTLWMLARIVTTSDQHTPRMLLPAAGGLPVLVADALACTEIGRYGFREFQPGGSVHLAWQVCGVLLAAAALSPERNDARNADHQAVDRTSRPRFVVLVSVALLTPLVLVIKLALGSYQVTPVPLVGLSVTVCILVSMLVVRLANVARSEVRRADLTNLQSAVMAQQAETLQRALDRQHVLQGELAWRATHDPLTHLGNRTLLAERLTHALDRSGSSPSGALLVVDLDGFKEVNDLFGHPAGDRLLIQVSQRLTSSAEGGDHVARIGGDEFAVVIEGSDPAVSGERAESILKGLREAYFVDDCHHYLTASVGLVILVPGSQDASGALRDADLAMYAAKRAGGNRVVAFALRMRDLHERHHELATGVRTAIAEKSLRVEYQPIIAMESGRVVALEALLRWRAPSGRSFSPGEFVAVAEDIGMVASVGAEVLHTALADAAEWNALRPISVSVNASGRELMSPTYARDVLGTLEHHAVSPDTLILEITETVLVHATEAVGMVTLHNLDELRREGVRIAVDDFGTGYSSLAYLQRLPIDVLKLDRMFTSALEEADERDVRFVGAILGLGASLGLPVVAEGVETARQAAALYDLGCPLAQGFHFGRPCPPDQVSDYLAKDFTLNDELEQTADEPGRWQ